MENNPIDPASHAQACNQQLHEPQASIQQADNPDQAYLHGDFDQGSPQQYQGLQGDHSQCHQQYTLLPTDTAGPNSGAELYGQPAGGDQTYLHGASVHDYLPYYQGLQGGHSHGHHPQTFHPAQYVVPSSSATTQVQSTAVQNITPAFQKRVEGLLKHKNRGYQAHIRTAEEMVQYERAIASAKGSTNEDKSPAEDDKSTGYPDTEAGRLEIVRRLYEAFFTLDGEQDQVSEALPNRDDCLAYKAVKATAPIEAEVLCFNLMEAMLLVQRGDHTGPKVVQEDDYTSKVDKVVEVLKYNKAICRTLKTAGMALRIASDPVGERTAKVKFQRNNNNKRAVLKRDSTARGRSKAAHGSGLGRPRGKGRKRQAEEDDEEEDDFELEQEDEDDEQQQQQHQPAAENSEEPPAKRRCIGEGPSMGLVTQNAGQNMQYDPALPANNPGFYDAGYDCYQQGLPVPRPLNQPAPNLGDPNAAYNSYQRGLQPPAPFDQPAPHVSDPNEQWFDFDAGEASEQQPEY
ncbi:hypothetical protein KVR01_005855 [Diaporthe batatas]|uniref:uncharacterized protein n=1 Tax=Diaporthe batatas TaxID=748121 RepID=UPI001D05156F|nr:uncharacterized protein KVR01_005855 [Diaporthe batatas]KAG8163937.1 hypothetical protein KVR01_005855 [Diaporthe batatas]